MVTFRQTYKQVREQELGRMLSAEEKETGCSDGDAGKGGGGRLFETL
jgi:hypothetical protein